MKILILALLVACCLSELGIDLSTSTSKSSFTCFLQEKYTFLNVRAWHSYGGFDVNAPQTLLNALQAGYKEANLGVYMFPCFSTTKKPEDQMAQMISSLSKSKYSQIWLDMETNSSPGCGWEKDYTANCQFTAELVAAAKKSGKTVGIYASTYMWNIIMGGNDKCPRFVNIPIWYAHYDGIATISDFKSFGGWTKAYAKQYKGTTTMCQAGVDLNYRS